MTNKNVRELINQHVADDVLRSKLLDVVKQEERHERWEFEKRRRGKLISLDYDEYRRTRLEYELSLRNKDRNMEMEVTNVLNSIKQLSKHDEFLIEMLYFRGMSEREVATEIGVSKNAIHKRKQRILKKIKEILKKG